MNINRLFARRNVSVSGAALIAALAIGSVYAKGLLPGQTAKVLPATVSAHSSAYPKAPELAKGEWIGSPVSIAAQQGKVVLLTFWTHGCINCKRTLPYWNGWAKQYSSKSSGVTVVSVHTPELDFERVPANVRRFVKEKELAFPVVIDNEAASWNAYKVDAWPTTILIDKQGRIRNRWVGELNYENSGDYKKVAAQIEALRGE